MGVILNGILGAVRGKVGGVQGGVWKGIAYLKAYTIPGNPNTPAQQAQRSRFAAAVAKAQAMYSDVISNFWNPIAVKMSGFNYWMSKNIDNLGADPFPITVNNLMSVGSLQPAAISGAVLAGTTVTISYSTTLTGNGLATDTVFGIAIDKATGDSYISDGSDVRSDGSAAVTLPSGLGEDDVIAFTVATRGTGSSYTQSNSDSSAVTV